jgi:hypothetical protein
MGTNGDNRTNPPRGAAAREILVVVGVALAGLLLAALAALTSWHIPVTYGPIDRLHTVVGIVQPPNQGGAG